VNVFLLDHEVTLRLGVFGGVFAVMAVWELIAPRRRLTTPKGARFHPLEILLSMVIKMAFVLVIGAPVAAVVFFEILLNAASMFNHGNVRLCAAFDRALRAVLVTPDMHRVHHSMIPRETNSNFGFNLPWWDRLFGTYRPQPQEGHDGMTIGLPWFRDPAQVVLVWLLGLPLRKRIW